VDNSESASDRIATYGLDWAGGDKGNTVNGVSRCWLIVRRWGKSR